MRPKLTEKTYAVNRINDILRHKLEDLKIECTTPGVKLSSAEKLQALLDGKFKLAKNASKCLRGIGDYSQINEIWDINSLDTPEHFDAIKYDTREAALKLEAHQIKDRIMLGDFAMGLIKLDEFAEGKY